MARLGGVLLAVLVAVPAWGAGMPTEAESAAARLEALIGQAVEEAASSETPAAELRQTEEWTEPFDKRSLVITLALLGGAVATIETADTDTVEDIGDILQIALPLSALGSTYFRHDREGRKQFARSWGYSSAMVLLVKEAVEKTRPNAQGVNSFPSGHTASAFSGASFIHWRYGPRWGVPAFVLAGYTGASRVLAEKHFLDDVISGMSLSVLLNRYFTKPLDPRTRLVPLVAEDAVGITGRWSPRRDEATDELIPKWKDENAPETNFRYEWEAGSASVERNDVVAPVSGGEPVSFLFDEANNPTVTARIALTREIRKRHEVVLQVAPFEVRDFGRFAVDTNFAGEIIPALEELRTQYLLYDYRVRYRYRVAGRKDPERLHTEKKGFHLHVGGGLSFQDIVTTLSWSEGRREADLEEGNWVPFVHLEAGVELSSRLGLHVATDAGASGDDRLFDGAATLRYHLDPKNRRWDLGLGLRRIERRILTDQIFIDHERDQVVVSISYRFSWRPPKQ